MHQTERSNALAFACLLVIFIALYVPTPVQSVPSYRLTSAIVDAENPRDANDVFTTKTCNTIELEYASNRISRIRATMKNGTTKRSLFRSLDYHTMVLDFVAFDSGDPNRTADCQFENANDAKEFYKLLSVVRGSVGFQPVSYPVASVLKYDCVSNNCEDGQCAGPTCESEYHIVSANGRIFVETKSEPNATGHIMKRFIIRGEDDTTNMVFTSKSFNIKWGLERNNTNAMLCIDVRDFLFKIFIRFENSTTARVFHYYVTSSGDVNPSIPLQVPYAWQQHI